MTLHFVLRMNSAQVGACAIQRRSHLDVETPGPDVVCTYSVDVDDLHGDLDGELGRRAATVSHRYGDGRWALVRAALTAILEQDGA